MTFQVISKCQPTPTYFTRAQAFPPRISGWQVDFIMANEFIGIDVIGPKEVQAKLAKLPEAAQDAGVDEANAYLLNVVRTYPPRASVSRAQAYGQTFQSDKQRRWFFAALNSGEISVPYRRTQDLSRSWHILGQGKKSILVNESPYAHFVQQKETQANMMRLIGWKAVEDIVQERMAKILEKFDAGVKKAIHKLGLG